MNNWRSDGWVNPYYSEQQQGGETLLVVTPESESFEAGADAIYKYLLSQTHQDWLATEEGENCKGKWVFIPEEVKE